RGLLTGSKPTGKGDFRKHLPRFSGEAGKKNAEIVAKIEGFAKERGMTPAQVTLGWVLAKQPKLVPLLGMRTRAQLDDALGALEKTLTQEDVAALEAIVPKGAIEGTRYAEAQMAHLDSEKRA
ncbi:MAG TPA: aldo/keto reductase, partial [Polyangiaceae bacterium]